ncbi:integrase [Xanthomonas hortorum pv. gardneri]|nr:tyrosine-type recombinase/integrase [Xanthomonas hortorum]KLB22940.1 integrase [Xanthomonas hortorum pv. gardneri]
MSTVEGVPVVAAVQTALEALPAPHDGKLELVDLPVQVPGVRFELTIEQLTHAQAIFRDLFTHEIQPYADNSRKSIRTGQQCREQLTARKHQAPALNVETVDDVVEAPISASGLAGLLELRDMVYVAVSYDLLGRASEMVRLRWSDVHFDADVEGGATCTISRSKTDQQGAGVTLYLTPRSAQLLLTWQTQRLIAENYLWPAARNEYSNNPYIFHRLPRHRLFEPAPAADAKRLRWDTHLCVREADRIIKRATGEQLSAHSARVGAAQDMTRAGMDLAAIMQAGRWKTPTMPARYAENELATRAGKNRQKALAKLRSS